MAVLFWGHSYEFDNNDNWEVIENFAEYIGGRDDVWYATNIEIYDYVKDYISEEAYNSSPTVFLKVAVGKGMITFEQILDVIEYLLAGSLIN